MWHHWLPRFYLAGFTDLNVPPPPYEPHLWVYYLEQRSWKKRSPRTLARRSGYYTITDANGKPSHDLETHLSRLEDQAATLIRTKIAAGRSLTDEERGAFAFFVASMFARVPSLHETWGKFLADVGTHVLALSHQMYSENPEAFEASKESYRQATGKDDLGDLRPEDLNPSFWRIETRHPATVAIAFSGIETFAQIVYQMGWTFVRAGVGNDFITSDTPVGVLNPKAGPSLYGHGLKYKDIEVTLSLTRELAFLASWHNEGVRWTPPAPERLVKQVNMRAMLPARQFLVAAKSTFSGSEYLLHSHSKE